MINRTGSTEMRYLRTTTGGRTRDWTLGSIWKDHHGNGSSIWHHQPNKQTHPQYPQPREQSRHQWSTVCDQCSPRVPTGQLRGLLRNQAQKQEARSKWTGSRILLRGDEPLPLHGPEHVWSGQDTPFIPWPEAHTGRKDMGPPIKDLRIVPSHHVRHMEATDIAPNQEWAVHILAPDKEEARVVAIVREQQPKRSPTTHNRFPPRN
jgi:hypothetical protein